ncbi:polyphosphate polymerase domain-containing protein [Actinomyces mediterranea]|uniref:polyphosphate polymerase domain-containing protein n=1 Tax=Actinomyces mediterranea TaxID=1871028 RepID=UPI0009713920|nr:polyphosphate polymerase domain-containing protein [Actinomyces mediterranea]
MTPLIVHTPRIIRRSADALIPVDLDTIGLAELNERAQMLTRVDRKYVVTRTHIPDIMSGLSADTRVLSIDGIRSQAYASTYFDTPGLRSFFDTARPRRRRYKIRARVYLDSDIAFLEVKTRGERNTTVKTRIPCAVDDAREGRISDEGEAWVRDTLIRAGCEAPDPGSLRPVLRGSYTRATLLMPHGDGRATIDSDLTWTDLRHGTMGDGGAETLAAPDLVVIETKSGSTPSALDHLLWERGHRPARISKYATAMTALDPSLPTNRWARTLSKYFAA